MSFQCCNGTCAFSALSFSPQPLYTCVPECVNTTYTNIHSHAYAMAYAYHKPHTHTHSCWHVAGTQLKLLFNINKRNTFSFTLIFILLFFFMVVYLNSLKAVRNCAWRALAWKYKLIKSRKWYVKKFFIYEIYLLYTIYMCTSVRILLVARQIRPAASLTVELCKYQRNVGKISVLPFISSLTVSAWWSSAYESVQNIQLDIQNKYLNFVWRPVCVLITCSIS